MRSPNPKTLSTAIAKAEAFRPCAGTALHLTPAEARALIYETSAAQSGIHYGGNVPSRAGSVRDAWDVCGWSDVQYITGAWDLRLKRPVFTVIINRHPSVVTVVITTPALEAHARVLAAARKG